MKEILIALCAILAVTTARTVINAGIQQDSPYLLGTEQCTWGPSYWCQNITTSASCKATQHCIQHKWLDMKVPEDTDSVCGICKDMVQQARDQLESNETQQDLKTVFERSCMLIYVKPIVKECIKVVDQFVPELVETLASQMNPSVVCTVAGLCNSPRIDQLLLEYQKTGSKLAGKKSVSLADDELEPDECSKCFTIAMHMERKFNNTPRDRMLEQFLHICGDMGSFSDACSSIVLTYFDSIYSHLQGNFRAEHICHLSGQCSAKFHKHEDSTDKTLKVEVRPMSSVGMVEVEDDLPCKLCEQLVGHLRDLLVANTTEIEFKEVLEGICKQTKSFATECRAIVDEYYPEIYEYLTKHLDGNTVCELSGVCPGPGKIASGPLAPLVPEEAMKTAIRIFSERKENFGDVLTITEKPKRSEAEEMQLPIERMHMSSLAFPFENVHGKQACALCEYVLHYVQEAITNPATEEKVKQVLGKVCKKLPDSIKNECEEFVDVYGDAFVAILVQEIDPSQVCPMIHVCPSDELLATWKQIPKDYIIEAEVEVEKKPSCALCLLALTQIYDAIKDNKTEASIEAELDKLCNHLPNSLKDQCVDLVKGYSKELVEMLLADLTPQEVCVYIKLCDASRNPGPRTSFLTDEHGEIITNEIPEFPLQQPKKNVDEDVSCVLCEFAMQYIDKAISNNKTRNRIEKVVYGICAHLPKTISKECNQFVSEYADVVIDILSQDISPKEVCTMIGLCKFDMKKIQDSIAECALCEAVISTIDKLLDDPTVDADIENAVSKVCKFLPASKHNKCVMLMEVYEQSIINILKAHGDPKKICTKIALCSDNDYLALKTREKRSYDERKRCTWGVTYWCSDDKTAAECKAAEYCKEKVWKAESAAAAKENASAQPEARP